jgi:hypothetical protein
VVVVEADDFVAQLRELASLIESGGMSGNVEDGVLRASVAAAVASGRARGEQQQNDDNNVGIRDDDFIISNNNNNNNNNECV